MTEYEQKKKECWEEFKEKHFNGNAPWSPYSAFDFTFDRAYALGKQEKDAEETVIAGWVARNENGVLITSDKKPIRQAFGGCLGWFGHFLMVLDESLFPDITWESEPLEIELTIKRKNLTKDSNGNS